MNLFTDDKLEYIKSIIKKYCAIETDDNIQKFAKTLSPKISFQHKILKSTIHRHLETNSASTNNLINAFLCPTNLFLGPAPDKRLNNPISEQTDYNFCSIKRKLGESSEILHELMPSNNCTQNPTSTNDKGLKKYHAEKENRVLLNPNLLRIKNFLESSPCSSAYMMQGLLKLETSNLLSFR